jgi:hypothetical protein
MFFYQFPYNHWLLWIIRFARLMSTKQKHDEARGLHWWAFKYQPYDSVRHVEDYRLNYVIQSFDFQLEINKSLSTVVCADCVIPVQFWLIKSDFHCWHASFSKIWCMTGHSRLPKWWKYILIKNIKCSWTIFLKRGNIFSDQKIGR